MLGTWLPAQISDAHQAPYEVTLIKVQAGRICEAKRQKNLRLGPRGKGGGWRWLVQFLTRCAPGKDKA